jgi:tetratricopeptide (TPR) repeat protein
MGMFDQALALLEESKSITKESNFMYHQCLTFTNLGDVYHEFGSYDLALNHYKMSMALAEKMDMPIEVSINQLGIQKTYIAKNLFKEVEKTLLELVHMFKDKHEMTYVALTYFALTDYYINNNELNKALDMIEKPLVITQESNDQLNIFRAMRKKLDVLCLVNEGSIEESLIQETILFGEQQMFHYELAHLYFMLYNRLNNGKQETYLLKAKEEMMFFDECLLSKQIVMAIQNSSK